MSNDNGETVLEECLGPVDRVVVWSGHFMEPGVPREQWQFAYIVDVIEVGPSGGEIGLWDGPTHFEAMNAAREISRDWGGLPIIDRTFGGTVR